MPGYTLPACAAIQLSREGRLHLRPVPGGGTTILGYESRRMETSFTSGAVICQSRRRRFIGMLLVTVLAGCTRTEVPMAALRDRILAPEGQGAEQSPIESPADRPETLPAPRPVEARDMTSGTRLSSNEPSKTTTTMGQSEFAFLPRSGEIGCGSSSFTLETAIAFALENNPRLRVARAGIAEALGNRQIAFAP